MSKLARYFKIKIKRYKIEKRLTTGIHNDLKRHNKNFWRKVNFVLAKPSWKKLSKSTAVVDNQIMFRTYQDKYTCNPKYLCDELIKSGKDYKLIWAYSKKTGDDLNQFPPQVTLVKFGTLEYYTAMAGSKFWIDNAHNFTWEGFPKKDNQVLINLWHGSLGLKRIEPERDSDRRRRKAGKLDEKETDYCVSNSDFENDVFRTAYWPHNEILKIGHPRNDIMFSDSDEVARIKKSVCKTLGIESDCKLFLYAPTFRDDDTSFECFNIDYDNIHSALCERFGGKWVIITRMHFHTQAVIAKNQRLMGTKKPGFVVSGDGYNDMQELIAASDIGLTDYSSWICDFVLTRRPGFLFTEDYDSYVTERGFYYTLESTPFPIAKNNKQLIENIRTFDNDKYEKDVESFLRRLGCCEDGKASEALARFIDSKINQR